MHFGLKYGILIKEYMCKRQDLKKNTPDAKIVSNTRRDMRTWLETCDLWNGLSRCRLPRFRYIGNEDAPPKMPDLSIDNVRMRLYTMPRISHSYIP